MTSRVENIDTINHQGWSITLKDLLKLTKPVVALLVLVTALPAMLTHGVMPQPAQLLGVALGIFLTSMAGSILNQVVDMDIDASMERTRDRLVVTQRMSPWGALILGMSMQSLAVLVLYSLASPLAAAVALAGNMFYVIGYTMYLKRRTVQNIVIGGAAGSVGPLIGSAAAMGELTAASWVMFALIFLWTPPHFWALALEYKDDYARAKVPMMPVVMGDAYTRWQIFVYSLTLLPTVALLCWWVPLGLWVQLAIAALTIHFVWACTRLWWSQSNIQAMPVFRTSCIYLLLVYLLMTGDLIVQKFANVVV